MSFSLPDSVEWGVYTYILSDHRVRSAGELSLRLCKDRVIVRIQCRLVMTAVTLFPTVILLMPTIRNSFYCVYYHTRVCFSERSSIAARYNFIITKFHENV